MRRLVEIEPALLSCRDELNTDALMYATLTSKHQIGQWLHTLYKQAGRNTDMSMRFIEDIAAVHRVAKGTTAPNQLANEESPMGRLFSAFLASQNSRSTAPPVASAEQPKAAPPAIPAQLEDACLHDDVATVRRLLRTAEGREWALTKKKDHGDNLLVFSAFLGNVPMVEALLELNNGELANQAPPGRPTALLMAASKGHLGVLKVLLKHHGDSAAMHRTARGINALLVAAESGHNHCVKFLLNWNGGRLADSLSHDNDSALIIAAREGHKDVVRTLVDRDDVELLDHHNKKNCNALTVAAEQGHAEIVTMLLKARSRLAWTANDDMTPLLLAAQAGHADVLGALLNSPDGERLAKCVVSIEEVNALDLAERNGHEAAAKVLREFDGGSLIRKPGQ